MNDPTPFDQIIWTAAECANHLRQTAPYFLRKTRYADGFPDPLDIPGRPRWRAIEVTRWAVGERKTRENHAITA